MASGVAPATHPPRDPPASRRRDLRRAPLLASYRPGRGAVRTSVRSGLPLHADDSFHCGTLACRLRARVCIARQLRSERELGGDLAPRSSRRKRGIGIEFAHCRSDRCAQGRAIREALGDDGATIVRHGDRDDWGVQVPRLVAWLALGEPPTIDDHLAD